MSRRNIVAALGASLCLVMSLYGLGVILYWHHITSGWSDPHIGTWMPIGMSCCAGVFVFTRVVGE